MAGCCCEEKALKIFKNYPTEWDSIPWLSIIFESEAIDLTGFKATFILGDFKKEWTDLTDGIIINLTDEETGALPVGLNYATLIVEDTEGNSKPFSTAIPVEVLTWVEGNQELDTYNMTVNALLDNETQMVIKIETAKVSLAWVEEKIAEHNESEEAHYYIRGRIDDEVIARESADNELSNRIDEKQDKLSQSQLNAVNSGITATKVSAYDNHIANTTIHVTAQDKINWNNKQDAIPDLDTIRSNAQAGKNASDIISGYGNIVTHNVSEFATSAQGALADTALQPSDVIDNTSSNDTDKPLSANMGKSLQEQVDNLKARGRFLALWNCATGLAESNPPSRTYTYQSGDYFIVGVVAQAGQNNYRPDGSTYTTGVASTVIETQQVDTDDVYYYDGNVWRLQVNTQKEVSFVNIAGSPYDNTELGAALNDKQNIIDDLATIRAGASAGSTALQPSALNGYATQAWVGQQGYLTSTALNGYATEQWVQNQGYLTSIGSSDIINALGYTPYNSSNPAGYITSSALSAYATKQYVDDIVGDIETLLHNINSGS